MYYSYLLGIHIFTIETLFENLFSFTFTFCKCQLICYINLINTQNINIYISIPFIQV